MRALLRLMIACVALAFAAPAGAELYKWADEKGVTNYSNKRPEGPGSAKAVGVENRVSVYSPDPGFLQTVKTMRELTIRALAAPRPPEAPPYSFASGEPPLTPYEKCLQSGRVGCEDLYGQYMPSWYAAGYPYGYGFMPGYFGTRYPLGRFPLANFPRSILSPRTAFSQIPNGVGITPRAFSPREGIARSGPRGMSGGGRAH